MSIDIMAKRGLLDMKLDGGLLERLKLYSEGDWYPFHMPGHKRQPMVFPNPFSIDITEIDGFDNLYHMEGILKESMEWAAKIYGADRTYYLVNGSSCGILSAICGTTHNSDTILMSRNCHKSAYHGVFLNHLRVRYIYPQLLTDSCVQGGLLPDEIRRMLKTHGDIKMVFVVSPTYEGIVSDIKTIANICHLHKIPLIVDEAHGAHFTYGEEFPVSALELGADVVIQSVHKTLPSFTQTALLHVKKGYVDLERIERYLQIHQSSSPSYLLMAGIENCIAYMSGPGRMQADELARRLEGMRGRLKGLKHLKVMGREAVGKGGVYDLDLSKMVVLTGTTGMSGVQLDGILRERYHLEMEMCNRDSVTAITTVMDTQEGLWRLEEALFSIDGELEKGQEPGSAQEPGGGQEPEDSRKPGNGGNPAETAMTIFEAMEGKTVSVRLSMSVGRVSAEFVYVYPPGIPILVPGEVVERETVEKIEEAKRLGLSVQGAKDDGLTMIEVVEDGKRWEK